MVERVLITGGAGFVGLHLARRLLAHGADVVLLDDFSRGRQDDDFRAVAEHAETIAHDLTAEIPDNVLRGSFDSVYHLAGVVGVAQANAHPDRVLEVNLRSAIHILEWCRRRAPGAVFLSSTSEVTDGAARLGLSDFPTPESLPFALSSPTRPRACYALSKMVLEVLFQHSTDEFRVRIGRFHNIYGPRMGHEHVIPQFIDRALDRRDPFPIYGAQQSRAFCHIDDALDATVAVMGLATADPIVVNIGNDEEEVEIIHLAERVMALCGYRPATEIFDPPADSPDRRLPDLTRLRETVGYRPKIPLDVGLRNTHEWYASRRSEDAGLR